MKREKTKMEILFRENCRPDLSDYTRKDLIEMCPSYSNRTLLGDKKHWCFFIDVYCICVLGDRIFWRKSQSRNITYKDGRIYGAITREDLAFLFKVFNLNWIEAWCLRLIEMRKDILTQIFSGKITNPELLCKYVSKRYYGGVFSYRTLKNYACCRHMIIRLSDLYYYSTNPDLLLQKLTEKEPDCYEWQDVLHFARILNQKINPLWSAKRLAEEHQKQIEAVNLLDINKYSDRDIMDSFHAEGLSLITNNKECFIEGCKMHNCINSCYWSKVACGRYLLLRGVLVGEEYVNLGVYVEGDSLEFDQVHIIRNGAVQDVKPYRLYIDKHKEELLNIIKTLKKDNGVTRPISSIPPVLPF